MSQHYENVEVDLIKGIRAAEESGDHQTRNRLFETLRCLYEDDAERVASRYCRNDEVSRGNLKGHLLARLESPIRNYDYETYDSFHLYVMDGWKLFAIREFRRQIRSQRSVVYGVPQSAIISLEARISPDETSPCPIETIPDSTDGPGETDGRIVDQIDGHVLLDRLCASFDVADARKQEALRDTIIGDAAPAARRIGLSILSRKIEHRSSISRFWAGRFWADAATRRTLWRELSEIHSLRD